MRTSLRHSSSGLRSAARTAAAHGNQGRRLSSKAPPGRFGRLFGRSRIEQTCFILFAALICTVALLGGSSWPSAWQLLLLRPAAVLLVTTMLLVAGLADRKLLREPGLLLAALAVTIIIQLVPLPPSLWTALPGRVPYLEAAAAAGMEQPWRPITLSIDLTLNSLVALLIPAAVLIGMAVMRPDQRSAAAGLLVLVAIASALAGLLQLVTGSFHFHNPLDRSRPVGLFANINHQAAFLAAAIPVAAAWAVDRHARSPMRLVLAAAAITLLLAIVLVSGSRSGLLLAALALLSVPLVVGARIRLTAGMRRLVIVGTVAAAISLVAAIWFAGRLGSLDRLMAGEIDQRLTYLPVTLGLLRDYAPFGSGFGTFNAVFRQAEPDALLQLSYFNHAHNDPLELGITGGVAALTVAAAYVVWLSLQGLAMFRTGRGRSSFPLARAGLFASGLLLLGSLTDYPLRTPLVMATLAIASVWIADRRQQPEANCF